MKRKSLEGWTKLILLSIRKNIAEKVRINFYEESLKRKSLEGWTKFILCSIRKNIAKKARISFWTKTLWRGWRKALKKGEILKGMKFTACFIHNQWLIKKVVLILARRVHSSMIQRINQVQIIERVNKLKAGKVIDSWKFYVNLMLKSKIFNLKSQKLTIKYLLARGLRKLQLGIEVSKAQKDLIESANTHYKKKLFTKTIHVWFSSIAHNCRKKAQKVLIGRANTHYKKKLFTKTIHVWFSSIAHNRRKKAQKDLRERANTHYKKKLFTKTIHVWFSSIVHNFRKKVRIEQAEKFYEDRLKNWVFQCLKFISKYWQTKFDEKINEYKNKRTSNILVQWRSKSVNNLNKIFPGFFYYIVFYLLMPYSQIPINKFEFSNISQRINRKKIAQSNNLLKTYVNDKLFTRWKNYTITIKSKTNLHTAQKDPNIKVAAEYHQSNLISSVFYAWDSLISQHSVKRRRALLHSIFLEWKIATRENSLLQKYLLESGYLKDI